VCEKDVERRDGPNDWWVYSTAVGDGVILVENRTTRQRGVVRDPTREEWGAAFHAPSNPYRWPFPERVIIDAST
jgi:hypothetical protein